ncbi:MAG: NAD-dependent epimerase/dehydratase family protein [Chitinivibrionales bacterium]
MGKKVLITGGAGFIGSHLADELLASGYAVRVLDNLCPQVHGAGGQKPAYLSEDVEFLLGDVCDRDAVDRAVEGVEAVFHFAAAVGVGQSMYEIEKYTNINNRGTAVLLESLMTSSVQKLVVASSMSIYGEGLYRDADGAVIHDARREDENLRKGAWEVSDGDRQLVPIPTPEHKQPALASIYALSKYDQERMCLMFGDAYKIPTVALRFFNVYGPRQALSNPYTGVLAIFASRLLNEKSPMVFEDGLQKRDFVSVYDIARACRAAMEKPEAAGRAINVGSGKAYTVESVGSQVASVLDKPHLEPIITGKYRTGDIRHCFSDISLAAGLLDYHPRVELEDGLKELAQWLEGQIARDQVEHAHAELSRRGLTV